jgi:hypothetical protein
VRRARVRSPRRAHVRGRCEHRPAPSRARPPANSPDGRTGRADSRWHVRSPHISRSFRRIAAHHSRGREGRIPARSSPAALVGRGRGNRRSGPAMPCLASAPVDRLALIPSRASTSRSARPRTCSAPSRSRSRASRSSAAAAGATPPAWRSSARTSCPACS